MTDESPEGPKLEREGDVYILNLGNGENRFNPDQNTAVEEMLAEVESAPAPRALVTTATGKIWSNGLDLEWMGANQDQIQSSLDQLHRLFAAFLGAGIPTIAAVQGHAFAGGAMLAICHDQIVMREDRGFWCVPEVDLGLPFTPGMSALLQSRLSHRTAHEAMTTGRRYGGSDAVDAGIASEVQAESDVLPRAVELATALAGKNPDALRAIKGRMYEDTLEKLLGANPVGG